MKKGKPPFYIVHVCILILSVFAAAACSGNMGDTPRIPGNMNHVGKKPGDIQAQVNFDISLFIAENDNIRQTPWFHQLRRILDTGGTEYTLVSLFRSVCDGCASGNIVRELNTLHTAYPERVHIISIVPRDFSPHEIRNLKEFLHIQYPVLKAGNALETKWSQLTAQYGESRLSNLVFLVHSSGTIAKAARGTPGETRDFFQFTYYLLQQHSNKPPAPGH